MTTALFSVTFLLAAPFWALMILLPRWSWSARIISSPLIVLPVVAIYALLVLPALAEVLPAVASPTLDGLRGLLGTPTGAAAAWAHMIAFDLFVGRWAYLDSRQRGVPELVMRLVLALTVLLGPLGLAAYLGARASWRRPRQATPPADPPYPVAPADPVAPPYPVASPDRNRQSLG
ncbi:ABA4-like family protein [Plantactinospora siamensis]|uniref:ABA4-like family protein n=1 Tax=Plantactinospora siamensis TaxID=555372 RepID=A0ABV6P2W9_9ACTN